MNNKHKVDVKGIHTTTPPLKEKALIPHLDRPGHSLVPSADATHDIILASTDERTAEAVVHPKLLILIHEHHQTVPRLLKAPLIQSSNQQSAIIDPPNHNPPLERKK